MSRRVYEVRFTDEVVNAAVAQSATVSELHTIPEWRRQALSKLEWIPMSTGEFSIPDALVEFEIPDEWTAEEGVERETMLVSVKADALTLVLPDGALKEDRCDELVRRFVGEIHMRATGTRLKDDEVEVSPVAALAHYACEFCSERVMGLPYTCPVCRRCFCYEHRRPETHGCSRQSRETGAGLPSSVTAYASTPGRRPPVVIRKVPCG